MGTNDRGAAKGETASAAPGAAENGAAPPAYALVADQPPPPQHAEKLSPEELARLNSAFSSLTIPDVVSKVNEDTCLAHLKLLSAFCSLKEDVGYTDGLWEIYDSRASKADLESTQKNADPALILAKLREKRWALYVARAVDRYEAWWNSFPSDPLKQEDYMNNPTKYEGFTKSATSTTWTAQMLPPLDVLMVWHAHMLNPRDYLEDCMRLGRSELWTGGFPWKAVNEAIDTSFDYNVSDDCIKNWTAATGRAWDNTEDPATKKLKCPACLEPHDVPWTTCGIGEDSKEKRPGLVGEGFGDGKFQYTCFKCGSLITKEFLELARFVKDVQMLLLNDTPMPGTILSIKNGRPEQPLPALGGTAGCDITFPNRLLKSPIRSEILEIIKPGETVSPPQMSTVRRIIETAIASQDALKQVEGTGGGRIRHIRLLPTEKIAIRKMMAHYWENFTPFALELGGAVLRQSIFADKMHKIDWLHSPAARDTMKRLVTKYERFIQIMALNKDKMAVPTLDVDLAWHTHQLSPRAYYDFTVSKATKFIDHDDKVNEDKLSTAFEWTSKMYQDMFGDVYSECTCWYCESTRAAHISSVGKLLGVSKSEKILNGFYDSGRANLCPPDASACVSAHNSVKFVGADASRVRAYEQIHRVHIARLEENYRRAQKRAQKKGRTLPPRDDYYYYWGYPYMMYGPWVYPVYWSPGMWYGDPGMVAAGSGAAGACVNGTCGGGSGGGACAGTLAGGCGGSGACGSAASAGAVSVDLLHSTQNPP
ncbi:hypothetical protein BX600DRAFT_37569 [Xylariales sp. PMI_506]|nr:hypothetical protein BX600DRAFT_37569 [Xylariales sp. PMI_506]